MLHFNLVEENINNQASLSIDVNCDGVVFIGDLHGNFESLKYIFKHYKTIKNHIFIVCGDCGFGFNQDDSIEKTLSEISKKYLQKYNNYIFFIRGNHDDPSYFTYKIEKHHYSPNIFLIPDYSIIKCYDCHTDGLFCNTTLQKSILCIGGGISIDRYRRVENETYWKGETTSFNPYIMSKYTKIDTVVTHSAPFMVQPLLKERLAYFLEKDKELENDLIVEGGVMDAIFNYLTKHHNITGWFYGHYHHRQFMLINKCKFQCLDMVRNGIPDFYKISL